MADAPRYRIWPPAALGLPLIAGLIATASAGDPVRLPAVVRPIGWAPLAALAV
jgi:hypothetical protein